MRGGDGGKGLQVGRWQLKTVDLPAVAFGWPPRAPRAPARENGFTLPGFFEFLRRSPVLGKLRHQGCADTRGRNADNMKGAGPLNGTESHADPDLFTRSHGMGRFYRASIHFDTSRFDGCGGQGTRFEGADSPEPLVKSGCGFVGHEGAERVRTGNFAERRPTRKIPEHKSKQKAPAAPVAWENCLSLLQAPVFCTGLGRSDFSLRTRYCGTPWTPRILIPRDTPCGRAAEESAKQNRQVFLSR